MVQAQRMGGDGDATGRGGAGCCLLGGGWMVDRGTYPDRVDNTGIPKGQFYGCRGTAGLLCYRYARWYRGAQLMGVLCLVNTLLLP